jgi:hypothetical protein
MSPFKASTVSLILKIAVIGFVISFIWENLQAPFYQGFTSYSEHVVLCLPASFGDALIVLLLYGLFATLKRTWWWLGSITLRDTIAIGVVGGIIGIAIEKLALLQGWWNYTETMPLLPWLGVGLAPVLLTAIVPVATFLLARRLTKQ